MSVVNFQTKTVFLFENNILKWIDSDGFGVEQVPT